MSVFESKLQSQRTGQSRRSLGFGLLPIQAVLLLVVVVLVGLPGAHGAVAQAKDHPRKASGGAASVLVIGTSGMNWNDLAAADLKQLKGWQRILAGAGIANNNRQSQAGMTCPVSGWLSLGAGMRIVDQTPKSTQFCQSATVLPTTKQSENVTGTGTVNNSANDNPKKPALSPVSGSQWKQQWEQWQNLNRSPVRPRPLGLLAQKLAQEKIPARGIGPGARLALANGAGELADWLPRPTQSLDLVKLVVQSLQTHRLVLVDAGEVAPWETLKTYQQTPLRIPAWDTYQRAQALTVIKRLDLIFKDLPAATTVLLVDLADSGPIPHLGWALKTMVTGEECDASDAANDGWSGGISRNDDESKLAPTVKILGSQAIRQRSLVQTIDFTQEILASLGQSTAKELTGGRLLDWETGTPWKPDPAGASDKTPQTADPLTWAELEKIQAKALRADLNRIAQPWFYTLYGAALAMAVTAVIFGLLNKTWQQWPTRRLKVLQAISLWAANLYFAGPLTDCLPLPWLSGSGSLAWPVAATWNPLGLIGRYLLAQSVIAAGLVALQWAICAVLQRTKLGQSPSRPLLGIIVAAGNWLALAGLTVAGSPDQVGTVIGSTAMTATRFYGMNNNKYGYLLVVTCALIAWIGAFSGDPESTRNSARRRAAIGSAVLLVLAVIVDGYPSLGSDVGGPLGLIVGGGITWLLTYRGRVRALPVIGLFGASAVAVGSFAVVDYLSAVEKQTHLARFVDDLRQGGGSDIVVRKATMLFNSFFGSALSCGLTVLAVVVILAGIWVYRKRCLRIARSTGGRTNKNTPIQATQKPYLIGVLVGSALAVAMNDTGAVILVSVGHFLTTTLVVNAIQNRLDNRIQGV